MKGYVQVYTGNGKGKTTAAIGLAIRALGAGKRVLFIQFMKGRGYSEHKILERLAPELTLRTVGKPFFIAREGEISEEDLALYGGECVVFPPGCPPADYVALAESGLAEAAEALASGAYDLVILDEINCTLHFELLCTEAVLAALAKRAPHTEAVLTGRMAPRAILDAADLVTEMVEVKHYYTRGVEARLGIEN